MVAKTEAVTEDVVTLEIIAKMSGKIVDEINKKCLMINEVQILKTEKESIQQQLDELLSEAHSDDSTKKDLEDKLALAENHYHNARDKLKTLMEELSKETSQLESKSLALREMEDRDVKEDNEQRARRQLDDDCYQMKTARSISQQHYLEEIKVLVMHIHIY